MAATLRKEYPEEMAEISDDIVHMKVKSPGSTFQKLKKIQETPSGSAGKITTKWEFFDCLSFLADTVNDVRYATWSLLTTMETPSPAASSAQPSPLCQATLKSVAEENSFSEFTLSVSEHDELVQEHISSDYNSNSSHITYSSCPSSVSSVSFLIGNPDAIQEGLVNDSPLPAKPCSPHPETSKTPASKRGLKRQREGDIMLRRALEYISTISYECPAVSEQTYASSIGKSVECALKYYPMDVQFELGSRISKLLHTHFENTLKNNTTLENN